MSSSDLRNNGQNGRFLTSRVHLDDTPTMNFALGAGTDAGKKKKQPQPPGGLQYGLNTRSSNVLDDDDESEEEQDEKNKRKTTTTTRDEVNQDLAAEQAALRKRAAAAVYDFDGTYDDFQSDKKDSKNNNNNDNNNKNRESRYIGNLLKTAKRRAYERDLVYERKIARDQAMEGAENEDYAGKEKFVTAAYKRKLAERQQWAREDQEQAQKDAAEDVTKRKDGSAMASFYGNLLHRNVAMGETNNNNKQETNDNNNKSKDDKPGQAEEEQDPTLGKRRSILDGFEPATGGFRLPRADSIEPDKKDEPPPSTDERPKDPKALRRMREEKVAQARIRYFQRHGLERQ